MLVFRLNLLSRVLAVSAREIRHLGEIKTSQLCPHKGEIRHAGYKPLRGWRTTCMFPATHPYPDQHHSSTGRATNCCPAPALTWVGSNSLNCKILLSQVFVGRQAARRQLCRSKGSVSSTRGPEVSNWRQKPFAPKHAQCNAVMLLAQLHQVGNRDEERKKASSQRDPRHPSYHSLGAAPLLNPCLFSCAKPSRHLSGACRRQLSAQQGRWQAGGTLRLLLLATGTLRWVQEGFRLQMSKVRWANRIPLLQSVAASTRQIL